MNIVCRRFSRLLMVFIFLNSGFYNISSTFLYSQEIQTVHIGIVKEQDVDSIARDISDDYFIRGKAILRAMESINAGVIKAEADINRPSYHFKPLSKWMNDINGPIYYKDNYHIFYQHNPYSDEWGHMHWGHAVSKDLVNWEHLPVALWPSWDKGELHCFSGCSVVNDKGDPMIFYTKVTYPEPQDESELLWPLIAHEQWAAVSYDDKLMTWEKHPSNPIIELGMHPGEKFRPNWRDPFIFRDAGRTFMILGADFEEEAVIPVYETETDDFSRWGYKGILFRSSKDQVKFFECPNFFKLGDKWVLLYSVWRPIEYQIGSFDTNSLKFTPRKLGILDYGDDLYASNILFDDNRVVLLGWIKGFKKNKGWNGYMILPRILSTDEDGNIIQFPVSEAISLRKSEFKRSDFTLDNASWLVEEIKGKELEINMKIKPLSADVFGINLFKSKSSANKFTIRVVGDNVYAGDTVIPIGNKNKKDNLKFRIFIDNSVVELFIDDGKRCLTKVFYPAHDGEYIEIFSERGSIRVEEFGVWKLSL